MGILKNFSSKIFTLSYPKYRFFVFLIVLILLFIIPVEVLENSPNLSICSRILGDKCYSVGITRGVSSLLKGNFSQALEYNFLSFGVLFILICFIMHDFSKTFINWKSI